MRSSEGGEIVLVLSYNSGEVRGLFCKIASARGLSPARAVSVWADFAWATPLAAVCSHMRALHRVGRVGGFIFLFHKQLEIVF